MRYLKFFFNAGMDAELPDLKQLTSEQLDRMQGPIEPKEPPFFVGYFLLLTVLVLPLMMLSVLFHTAGALLLCIWAVWGAIGLMCYLIIYSNTRKARLHQAVREELYDREH